MPALSAPVHDLRDVAAFEDFDRLGRLLEEQKWIFAKTMPKNPHWYCLRKNWTRDEDFCWAVEAQRRLGYESWFWRRKYIQLDVNENTYWTMGESINTPEGQPWTILINRKPLGLHGEYDEVAGLYDSFYQENPRELEIDAEVLSLLRPFVRGNVLDVGCGTGWLVDNQWGAFDSYEGFDPSRGMLGVFLNKHPDFSLSLRHCDLSRFVGKRPKYDTVLALFGVGAYLTERDLARIRHLTAPGGHYFVMFYDENYRPALYDKGNFTHSHAGLLNGSLPGVVIPVAGRYLAVHGQA